MQLPSDFLQIMKGLIPEELDDFLRALNTSSPVSIRTNPEKSIKQKENIEQVKWCSEGLILNSRPSFTLDPLFHAGAYYVQEASSMFLSEVIRQLVDQNQAIKALDLCAAPGGKSTLMASSLPPNSLLLCNEIIKSRYKILRHNLIKWGKSNTFSCNLDSKALGSLGELFDLILVDAPCSGEGLFRKSPKAIQEWSLEQVHFCAARQKRILAEAQRLLRPGGILLYSTCTFNTIENDENVQWLKREFPFQSLSLDLPPDWGIQEREAGYQFYPHKLTGEGFFLACLKKQNSNKEEKQLVPPSKFNRLTPISKKQLKELATWMEAPSSFEFFLDAKENIFAIPRHVVPIAKYFDQKLRGISLGIHLGAFKKENFIPSHQFALSGLTKSDLATISLTKEEALKYLKKETFPYPSLPKGWIIVKYQKQNLGWIKGLGNRFNNYFPKEWRIQMAIPK